jgi:hypothetical protein
MPSFFDSWLPYIYLYGVGGIFFFFGMILLTRIKALDLSIKKHRNWFKVLIGGYFYFAFMHAFLIISALYF